MDLFNQLEVEYKALTWCYSIPEEASVDCRFASYSRTERKALFAQSVGARDFSQILAKSETCGRPFFLI